jgi:putative membrane protein insertion efficiency factor
LLIAFLNCAMPALSRIVATACKRRPDYLCAGLLVVWFLLNVTSPAEGLETNNMKAPKSALVSTSPATVDEAGLSALRSALLGSTRFFQKWISPIDGPRCSFSPTCSQFGYEAVHSHGPFLGVVMTADRLMRCNYWTEPGQDYIRLPNGALYDPVPQKRPRPL